MSFRPKLIKSPKLKADGDYFVPVAIFNAQPRLLEFLLLQKEENAIFWYKKEVDFILSRSERYKKPDRIGSLRLSTLLCNSTLQPQQSDEAIAPSSPAAQDCQN